MEDARHPRTFSGLRKLIPHTRTNQLTKVIHPACTLGKTQMSLLATCVSSKNDVVQKGFAKLLKTTPLDYVCRPIENVDIGPYGAGLGHEEFVGDCMQTYQQVLLYVATKNDGYAKNAIRIVEAWCDKCKSFKGANAPLECAWGGAVIVRAVELLKNVYTVPPSLLTKFQAFLDVIIIPNLTNRYLEIVKWNNNWILSILEAILQIALFRDNIELCEWVFKEFQKALGCCVAESGMNTEIKRDQIHSQFQIGSMVQIAELFWQQNVNAYMPRIQKCMEYQAKVLMGWVPDGMKKEELKQIEFTPCSWDIGYNHFVNREKKNMPETTKLLSNPRNRPEKLTFNWGPAWLHYAACW